MSGLGFKSVVFHGDLCLGELDTVPATDRNFRFPNNEIRIHHISPKSERCPPHSILQTIASFSVRCKLESPSPTEQPHLINLHASCFYEFKTAVVLLGHEEIHLVAMRSKQKKFPCFWCYSVPLGLYNASLGKLNLRCLSIVFDLDETLIVANTMKSFEDRIEALRGWIAREVDPVRLSGMSAEMKRIMDDRALLKQYLEKDRVDDNGKVYEVQLEEVSPLSSNQEKLVRPVIRLQEKNIVLTRIDPENRDTSVLVRLRTAWEDLRSYLTAKDRKRFEVYVCTMAERHYAFEMWRLLDPGFHLIASSQLSDRITCVKSGSRKSLLSVFQDGICHPKMAMVIDDRLNVWEDKDQPRVHVVPAFTPYYAPQAETANAVPVLCVARNVACNVRGYFFKEFDDNLLRRISEIFYEDEIVNLPPAPDVSNYLMSEDPGFVPNGNTSGPVSDGMHGTGVERRLNQPNVVFGAGLHGAPVRGEFSAPANENDMNRRLLTMKHGIDMRNQSSADPSLLSRPPSQLSGPSIQPHLCNRPFEFGQESDAFKSDKHRVHHNSFGHSSPDSTSSLLLGQPSQAKGEEAHAGYQMQNKNLLPTSQLSGVCVSHIQVPSNRQELLSESAKVNLLPSSFHIGVLQEIGRRCSSKVEFRSTVSTSKDSQFSVEVFFTGEKIGVGVGKTRKDAQQQAAENALHCLSERYVAYVGPSSANGGTNKLSAGSENGFLSKSMSLGSDEQPREDGLSKKGTQVGEVTTGSSKSGVVNELVRKRANSLSVFESIPSKRLKEEIHCGKESLLS